MAFFPALSRTGLFLAPVVLVLLTAPLAARDEKQDPAATRQYAVAAGLQNKKLYPQAARRWETFITSYPKDPRLANAYHHLGACQLHDKQPAKAAQTFRTLIEKFPKSDALDAAHFNLGLALYNVGLTSQKAEDLKTAAGAFAEAAARFPKSKHAGPALYHQGESLYRANDVAGAVALYSRVIKEHPGSDVAPDAYYALGTAQQELGQAREAAATFQAFLAKHPRDKLAGECQVRLGLSLFAQKRYAEASRVFEQAAALPGFALADFSLMQQARCAYEQKQVAGAAGLYEAVAKKFPAGARSGPALLAAGKCWYELRDLPKAQSALTAALTRKFDGAAEAAYWLGLTLLKRNKPGDAVAVLDRAIAAHPKSAYLPQLTFTRINALYEQPSRQKESAALFADFAGKHPGHELAPRALYMAALAALAARDHAASQKHAAGFLARFARHELAAEVLFVGGEAFVGAAVPVPSKAEGFYRKLLAEHPRHKHAKAARLRVGLCLYLAKKYDAAVKHLREVSRDWKEGELLAEARLLIGRSHHDAGQAPQAAAAFQKALLAKPGWERGDEVLLALARSLHAQKKRAEATAQLERLRAAYPKSALQAHALYHLGEIAQERKEYDAAAAFYEQAAGRFPGSEPAGLARYALGTVWLAKKDHARAIDAFGKLIGKAGGPLAEKARYKRALAYQHTKQLEPAVKDFTAYLASKPAGKDALEARYALALCQSALGRHGEAAATLAALVREKPDDERSAVVYYEMGHCLLLAKKDKEAAEAFERLTAKEPDGPLAAEAWFRVGEYREGVKQLDGAEKAYTAGLKKAKGAALREKLHYRLGWVRYRRGAFAEAARTLQDQLAESPKGELAADATYLAGDSLFRQERFARAGLLFERLINAKDAKYRDRSLYRLGACRAGLKEWAASQRCYEELIRKSPKFELIQEAKYGLGWALQNQGKLEEAKAVYEQVTKATGSETAAKSRFMVGECSFKQKKHREAVEHFLEAALAYPYPEWQALGYFEAGRCFIALKDSAKALDALRTVVKKHARHPRAKDAAKLIAELEKGG
jgi:TolA-binding protein